MSFPSIFALATAVPHYSLHQNLIAEKMSQLLALDGEKKQQLHRLYTNSGITKRHSVISDFQQEHSEWNFWGKEFPHIVPGMSQRNDLYKKEAPVLALKAAQEAIKRWGRDPSAITHIISVSCTGMVAPGIEFDLMRHLQLSPSIQRLGINFMGCFGAFKGLAVAQAFARENPHHRILVVCTELCSLHLQSSVDIETLTANAIFADGAAAVIVGCEPQPNETVLWSIIHSQSFALERSTDKMSWEASNHGFVMRLSHTVPVLIGRHIESFTSSLLKQQTDFLECDWAVHPGGKSILQAVEKTMKLDISHTQASWDTLDQYGNMSSATFLFVLDRLYHYYQPRPWAIGVGFGPGLSIEGILLRHGEFHV